jgi:hypothetical protein
MSSTCLGPSGSVLEHGAFVMDMEQINKAFTEISKVPFFYSKSEHWPRRLARPALFFSPWPTTRLFWNLSLCLSW